MGDSTKMLRQSTLSGAPAGQAPLKQWNMDIVAICSHMRRKGPWKHGDLPDLGIRNQSNHRLSYFLICASYFLHTGPHQWTEWTRQVDSNCFLTWALPNSLKIGLPQTFCNPPIWPHPGMTMFVPVNLRHSGWTNIKPRWITHSYVS